MQVGQLYILMDNALCLDTFFFLPPPVTHTDAFSLKQLQVYCSFQIEVKDYFGYQIT